MMTNSLQEFADQTGKPRITRVEYEKMESRLNDALELLEDIMPYMDNKMDAEILQDGVNPNQEMVFYVRIRKILNQEGG